MIDNIVDNKTDNNVSFIIYLKNLVRSISALDSGYNYHRCTFYMVSYDNCNYYRENAKETNTLRNNGHEKSACKCLFVYSD